VAGGGRRVEGVGDGSSRPAGCPGAAVDATRVQGPPVGAQLTKSP